MDEYSETLALRVIPPRTAQRDLPALETAAQAWGLDKGHPIALEIVGTADTSSFIVRATSRVALAHLKQQIYARFPQAEIRPLPVDEDPLLLRKHETVSAAELRFGTQSHLPLKGLRERQILQEGANPVLGLLAASRGLPSRRLRVIIQLVLLPAPHNWSQAQQRLAVEHPLEQERMRTRSQAAGGGSSGGAGSALGLLLIGGLLLFVLRIWPLVQDRLPAWVQQALLSLVQGQAPHLSAGQDILLAVYFLGLIAPVLGLLILIGQVRQRLRRSHIYDMRLVQQKTSRAAYRSRLRVIVIGPEVGGPFPPLRTRHWQPVAQSVRMLFEGQGGAPPPARLRHRVARVLRRSWRAWRRRAGRAALRSAALDRVVAAHRQYDQSAGSYFVRRNLPTWSARRLLRRRRGIFATGAGWERGVQRSQQYMTGEEVVHQWNLPQGIDIPDLPFLERARARTLLAPTALTTRTGWRVGESSHAGYRVPVGLPLACVRDNLFAVASTGKGKTTLWGHLADAALAASERTGDGIFILEPHESLIPAFLERIPRARHDDVVYVNLADIAFPVGFNVLDVSLGDRDKLVSNLVATAKAQWSVASSASWGQRTEMTLDACAKTLVTHNAFLVRENSQDGPDNQHTVLDILPLLRHYDYRQRILDEVDDPALHNWWQMVYDGMDPRQQTETIGSLLNKITRFSSSYTARRILGQPRSRINLREIVQQGKILLVGAPSGIIGEDVAALVGTMILSLFMAALEEQVRVPLAQRRHYLALVDEFQFFAGANYQMALSRLRQMGGHFALATQSLDYLDKLDRTLRSIIFANIDHLFTFTTSGFDARALEQELDHVVKDNDITHLDDFQCYARLSLHHQRLPLFSLQLDPPLAGNPLMADAIRLHSRQQYAQPVDAVDPIVHQRMAGHQLRKSGTRAGGPAAAAPDEGDAATGNGTRRKRHAPAGAKGRQDGGPGAIAQDVPIPTAESMHVLFAPEQPEDDEPQEAESAGEGA
jgi:hypothetical protein